MLILLESVGVSFEGTFSLRVSLKLTSRGILQLLWLGVYQKGLLN